MCRQSSLGGFRHRSSVSHGQEGHPGAAQEATGQSSRFSGSQETPTPDTPLLMAPPAFSARAMQAERQGSSSRLYRQLHPLSELLRISFWLGLFLAKMMALARPCQPFMFNLATGLPLVLLAALDLGVTLTRRSNVGLDEASSNRARLERRLDWGPRTSLVLVGVHFLFAVVMDRLDMLCNPPPGGLAGW